MNWRLILTLSYLFPLQAGAASYDTAYLKRLLDSCNSLPETFEATVENFARIKDCGLSPADLSVASAINEARACPGG